MASPSGPVNRSQPAPKPVSRPAPKKAPVKRVSAPAPSPAPVPKKNVQQAEPKPVLRSVTSQPPIQTKPEKTVESSFRNAGTQLPSVEDPGVAFARANVEKSIVPPVGTTLASSGNTGNASGPSGGTQPADDVRAAAERAKVAADLGLNANATQAQIDAARLRLVNFTPGSPLAVSDYQDRAAINSRISVLKQEKPDLAAGVSLLETDPAKRKPEEVVADRYRIDPRGKTPEQLRQESELRVAQLSGLDPSQLRNMSAADLEAANRQRSLAWLATLPNSGIKADPADPNFKNVTYEQMLQGYRNLYGLPKEASWGDIQQAWTNVARNNNPELLKAAGMDRGQSEYFHYRQTSGLAALERAANPNAPSGRIYVLDGATFKTPDGKPVLGSDGQPVGFDVNHDGRVDVSHSRIVTELINDAIPQDKITLMNISTADGTAVNDDLLRTNLRNLATLSRTPGNVAAVNLSLQPYAVNGDPNTPNGNNLTFKYLSDTLGIPGLSSANIATQKDAVKRRINDIAQAYQAGTRTDARALEVLNWRETINSIEGVTANRVPVYLAAGNQGPDAFNVYGLANGVTMVGATDPNAASVGTSPVMADYSGKNPLISRTSSGYVTYTDTGSNAIDPSGRVTLNQRTGGRTGIDLNWDGRADFFLRDLSDNAGVVRALDQYKFITGTSFATPRTLVEDFQRGVFRVD
jgi:hypothetical protein